MCAFSTLRPPNLFILGFYLLLPNHFSAFFLSNNRLSYILSYGNLLLKDQKGFRNDYLFRGGGCSGGPEQLTRKKTRISNPGKLAARPRCSFAVLLKKAMTAGMRKDAVAIIEYNAEGYTFSIQGQKGKLRFAQNCTLVKKSR